MLAGSAIALFYYVRGSTPPQATAPAPSQPTEKKPATAPEPTYHEPVDNFEARITKKKFGTYITPQTSPVQPERFSGYHTGVDVEYSDVESDTPVKAIADGTVRYAGYVSGYGGVLVIEHLVNGAQRVVLYGHLDQTSLPAVGTKIKKGAPVGTLGKNTSAQTDGERKHLHFAILQTTQINFAGYVSSTSALSTWIDPLTLYQ